MMRVAVSALMLAVAAAAEPAAAPVLDADATAAEMVAVDSSETSPPEPST